MGFEAFKTVNWRTTLLALSYILCKVIAGLYPPVEGVCAIIEPLIVAGGFVSAADGQRVQRVVEAVDHLFTVGKQDLLIPPAPVEPTPTVAS